MRKRRNSVPLYQDIALIAVSVVCAVILGKSGVIDFLLHALGFPIAIESFIAGVFFTSVFTTAPAIVALGELAQHNTSAFAVALFGALGSVFGDVIIFQFVRNRFSEHLTAVLRARGLRKRLHTLLRVRFFRYLTFLAGGLIIASPLPDELGIGLLGFSKMRLIYFAPLSFVFNFVGIMLIATIAQSW